MKQPPQDSRSPSPKGRIPRNPWRHLSDVRDAPNMTAKAIRARYASIGREIADDEQIERHLARLRCFAAHQFPTIAVVVFVFDDPPGHDFPVPLCEYHAETSLLALGPKGRKVPADEWEGPLARRVRVDPPEQLALDA